MPVPRTGCTPPGRCMHRPAGRRMRRPGMPIGRCPPRAGAGSAGTRARGGRPRGCPATSLRSSSASASRRSTNACNVGVALHRQRDLALVVGGRGLELGAVDRRRRRRPRAGAAARARPSGWGPPRRSGGRSPRGSPRGSPRPRTRPAARRRSRSVPRSRSGARPSRSLSCGSVLEPEIWTGSVCGTSARSAPSETTSWTPSASASSVITVVKVRQRIGRLRAAEQDQVARGARHVGHEHLDGRPDDLADPARVQLDRSGARSGSRRTPRGRSGRSGSLRARSPGTRARTTRRRRRRSSR